jgi:hypothetical protein
MQAINIDIQESKLHTGRNQVHHGLDGLHGMGGLKKKIIR